MADRPAAELLAEWEAFPMPYIIGEPTCLWFAVLHMGDILRRLARAEHALAEIKALHKLGELGFCDCCERSFPCRTVRALRASQGDQT